MGVYVVRVGDKILVGISCLKSQAGRRLINHRTIDYLELEVTHRDHGVQPLAPHSTTQTQTLWLRAMSQHSLSSSTQGSANCSAELVPGPLPSEVCLSLLGEKAIVYICISA